MDQQNTISHYGIARPPGSARAEVLLVVVVALITVPVMQLLMAQQASRYALTASVWDHGTVVIDAYEESLSADFAIRDGRLYSDKAPGQPFLALPAYAVYRVLGGEPAEVYRPFGNVGLWLVSLWSAALPAALLAVVMRRIALPVAPTRATLAALSLAAGTMLLPFATVLFSHVLAGLLAAAAYLVVRDHPTARGLYAGGFLAATAVTVEYTAALAGAVVFGVAVVRAGRRCGWFLLGGVLPAVALAAYQWVAFGGPLSFSYHYSRFPQHGSGLVGVQAPDPGLLAQVLVGERGLFVLTPIVLLGVLGAAALAARRRMDGIVGLTVFGLFVLLMAGWSSVTAGSSPGPRYVVPALGFLAAGVAEAWRRWPVACWIAAVFGTLTMGLATYTMPLASPTEPHALGFWFQRARDGQFTDTVLSRPLGDWAIAVPLLAAAVLAVVLVRGERER